MQTRQYLLIISGPANGTVYWHSERKGLAFNSTNTKQTNLAQCVIAISVLIHVQRGRDFTVVHGTSFT